MHRVIKYRTQIFDVYMNVLRFFLVSFGTLVQLLVFAVLNECLNVNVHCYGSINCCYRCQCPQNAIYWEKSTVVILVFWYICDSVTADGVMALQMAPWVVRVLMWLCLTQWSSISETLLISCSVKKIESWVSEALTSSSLLSNNGKNNCIRLHKLFDKFVKGFFFCLPYFHQLILVTLHTPNWICFRTENLVFLFHWCSHSYGQFTHTGLCSGRVNCWHLIQ